MLMTDSNRPRALVFLGSLVWIATLPVALTT
jgi:hypothetical protein